MSDSARRPLPPSLYANTARVAIQTPPLSGDVRVSVAIIGGGFTGLSTALSLAARHVDCAVLEAHEPGWGASGRNGGQVNPGIKIFPGEITRLFGDDLGARMIRFGWGAPQNLFRMIKDHGIQCEAHQGGTFRAVFDKGYTSWLRAAAEEELRAGQPIELLDAQGCAVLTGTDRYMAGTFDPRGGSVNPLGLARGLAEAATNAGARIHGSTPALKMARKGTAWRIETPSGTVTAEKVLLATNGYTDRLWPSLRRSVIPAYTGIVATEPLPDSIAATILPRRNIVYEVGSLTTYYRLDAQNRLLMGGVDRQKEQSGVEASFRALRKYAERLWPGISGVRWTHGWNGLACMTTDHLPHIHEPAQGVMACVGYNGRGVALACSMGEQIARRLMGGSAKEFDMPITTLKEIPFHGFAKTAVAIRIQYGKIRDRLGL